MTTLDRARLLIEEACDEHLSEPDRTRNMKVAEMCNFFLYGERRQEKMAAEQLKSFLSSVNPENCGNAGDLIKHYRFQDLVTSLEQKYGSLPEAWVEQSTVYAEVSRSLYFILKATDLNVISLGLHLLETLALQGHRNGNRFLLEAVTEERLLKQMRVLWKIHHGRTGVYSMQITELILTWVQTWRDEIVPPSERRRYDPANQTKWSIAAAQSSIKSYQSMSGNQLLAAAQSGAHWLDKRVKENLGMSQRQQAVFFPLEECHFKLKKRGAKFPLPTFSLRSSLDIQRSSEDVIALDKENKPHERNAEVSPSCVAALRNDFADFSASKLQISISPLKEGHKAHKASETFASFSVPPPKASPPKPQKQCHVAKATFLEFDANPLSDGPTTSLEFDANPFADEVAPGKVEEDPFAELAMRHR